MKSVIEEFCSGDKFRVDIYLNGAKEKELLQRGIELEETYSQNMSREERGKIYRFFRRARQPASARSCASLCKGNQIGCPYRNRERRNKDR